MLKLKIETFYFILLLIQVSRDLHLPCKDALLRVLFVNFAAGGGDIPPYYWITWLTSFANTFQFENDASNVSTWCFNLFDLLSMFVIL